MSDAVPNTPWDALHELFEEAAALRGESRQAVQQSHAVQRETGAILREVMRIVTEVLAQHTFVLAAPVAARFQENERHNTGVAIEVRLADPAGAEAARRAIVQRFGGVAPHDTIDVY
jgi:hypothetical protein